ncbi:MAG: hypothetical protein JST12_16835, partial [Armatimonadetes bacterium]|nr:hypothetical protein [Armatimonadota bacterium]
PESPTKFEEFVRSVINPSEDEWLLPESLIPLLVKSAETSPRQAKRRINDLIVDTKIFGALQDAESVNEVFDSEEIAACMAVNRLFKDLLSPEQVKALAASENLRRQILFVVDDARTGTPEFEPEPSIAAIGSEILSVFRAGEYWYLFEKGAICRTWFENHELRQASREFLIASRGVEVEERQSQKAIVDEAIRGSLDLENGKPISKDHRTNVKKLSFAFSDLDNDGLRLLADLPSLRELDLTSTQVSDLAPLASLASLTWLSLANIQVSNLAPLAGLTSLTTLALPNTQVSDLTPLKGLTSLTALSLVNTQVSDLTPLARLTSLTWLNLVNTRISDLAPLASLTSLTTLALSNTRISDLTPLARLTSLTGLTLMRTQVSDLAPLAYLISLTELHLSNTQVSDLTPLKGLTSLRYLLIPESVSEAQRAQLRKSLPNLEIITK